MGATIYSICVAGLYFKNILDDYKTVAGEIWQDMKDHPVKSVVYIGALGAVVYACKHNPDETSFRTQLLDNVTELATLGDIRNPSTEHHVQTLVHYYNTGQTRHLNLGVCSLMWVDRFDRQVDLYEAQAKPLKVGWLDLRDRLLDIGFLDHWYWLDRAMLNYDINPLEWGEKPQEHIISANF